MVGHLDTNMRMCIIMITIKNNSPKNPYKSTGYDTQFLHHTYDKSNNLI